MLESTYEECMAHELKLRDFTIDRQEPIPINYKGTVLNCGYRLDLLVENQIILELKACDRLESIHTAQLLTYLKLTGLKLGLILNFNVPILKEGIVRLVNKL